MYSPRDPEKPRASCPDRQSSYHLLANALHGRPPSPRRLPTSCDVNSTRSCPSTRSEAARELEDLRRNDHQLGIPCAHHAAQPANTSHDKQPQERNGNYLRTPGLRDVHDSKGQPKANRSIEIPSPCRVRLRKQTASTSSRFRGDSCSNGRRQT